VHFACQRRQVARAEVAEVILKPMQVFDQQVARARRRAEQLAYFIARLRLDRAPLRAFALALPAGGRGYRIA
jgi:hypothetical protein